MGFAHVVHMYVKNDAEKTANIKCPFVDLQKMFTTKTRMTFEMNIH